jgi:8-oxo-dGTP diphosphatase
MAEKKSPKMLPSRLCRSLAISLSASPFYHPFQTSLRPLVTGFTPQKIHYRTNTSFFSSTSKNNRMAANKENNNNAHIDKLALILINSQNQQLVARSTGKSVFYTPGGKREHDESDKQALIRECFEELSVNLTDIGTIEPYGTFSAQAYGKPPGVEVRMTCYRIYPREAELKLEGLVKANAEIEELKWIDSSFDRERLTVTGLMILDDLKMKGLID